MGTNLFVEGFPAPVILNVRLGQEVSSFHQLSDVVVALRDIDQIMQKEWGKLWPSFGRFRQRRVCYLLKFHVYSPPEFTIVVDPAWLAIFITILANYKGIKGSTKEIKLDMHKMYDTLEGLTERQLQLLDIAVRLTLSKMCELGEKKIYRLEKLLAKIRIRLLREEDNLPKIKVVDVDKERPW